MSIGKKNKNHLNQHAGVSAVGGEPPEPPKSDDPLYFWTNHPTDNYAVNLHPLADGEFENTHPKGKNAGYWGGAYTGRPNLIAELAPAIQASVLLLSKSSAIQYESALRTWWRLFDTYENTASTGQDSPRIESVADLNALHETFARQRGLPANFFRTFRSLANATRQVMKLPLLLWESPKSVDPIRTMIPDDQAKELKTAIKQDWERVRKTWARNDARPLSPKARPEALPAHRNKDRYLNLLCEDGRPSGTLATTKRWGPPGKSGRRQTSDYS